MVAILDEQEHYLLVTDGRRYAVVEKCADKFYPLRNSTRRGVELDNAGLSSLLRDSGVSQERDARRLLAQVASQWRNLFEHVR